MTVEQAGAEPSARADTEECLDDLISGAFIVGERILPDLYPDADMLKTAVGNDTCACHASQTESYVAGIPGGDVNHDDIRDKI